MNVKKIIDINEKGNLVILSDDINILDTNTEYIIISIIGQYRTGKSFLINKLSNDIVNFETGNSTNSCTKGIYIGIDNTNKIIYLDVEGIFSPDSHNNSKLLIIAFLLSDIILFNIKSHIDSINLNYLKLLNSIFNKYKNNIHNKNKFMFILLRDFCLDIGKYKGLNDYFKSCIDTSKYELFKNNNYELLDFPYPFINNINDISKDFINKIKILRNKINNINNKHYLTLNKFNDMLIKYTTIVNNSDINIYYKDYDIEIDYITQQYNIFYSSIAPVLAKLNNNINFDIEHITFIINKLLTLYTELTKNNINLNQNKLQTIIKNNNNKLITIIESLSKTFKLNKEKEYNVKLNKLKLNFGLNLKAYNKAYIDNIKLKVSENKQFIVDWFHQSIINIINTNNDSNEDLISDNKLLTTKLNNMTHLYESQKEIFERIKADSNFYKKESFDLKSELNSLKRSLESENLKLKLRNNYLENYNNNIKDELIEKNKKIEYLESEIESKTIEIQKILEGMNNTNKSTIINYQNNTESLNISKILKFNDEINAIKYNLSEAMLLINKEINNIKHNCSNIITSQNNKIKELNDKIYNFNDYVNLKLEDTINIINSNYETEIKRYEEQIYYLHESKSKLTEQILLLTNDIANLKQDNYLKEIDKESLNTFKSLLNDKNKIINLNNDVITKLKTKIENYEIEIIKNN